MEAARSQGSQPQGAPSLRRRVLGRDKSACPENYNHTKTMVLP